MILKILVWLVLVVVICGGTYFILDGCFGDFFRGK